MLNRMTLQLFRQWAEKVFTNPFPVPHMPDSLTGALKAAAKGKIEIQPPVEPPERFRGRIAYEKTKCIGCKLCIKVCPANAITFLSEEKKVQFHVDRCCFCEQCTEICPVSCIWMTEEFMLASYDRKQQVVSDSGPRPRIEREETAVPSPAAQKFEVDGSKCIGCTKCARICPVKAISGTVKQPHVIDKSVCVGCGACAEGCPVKAINPSD